MGQYAKRLRNKLNNIIDQMAEVPYLWAKNPVSDSNAAAKSRSGI